MRAGSVITAHPKMPEKSIPLATVTSARNTVRLAPGLKFRVSRFTKSSVSLTAESSGQSPDAIQIGSQALLEDREFPTIITADAAGLPLVTSGLIRIGMHAEVITVQSASGEKLMALRIDISLPVPDDTAIVFENIRDGTITLRKDNRPDRVIGKVIREATGTGRIDGTENLGNGTVAEAGQSFVVLSSSQEAAAPRNPFSERRGGLQITSQTNIHPYSVVMKDPLPIAVLNGFAFGGKSHIADVQRENGDWERFPSVVGHRADTFVRPHAKGKVIAIRIRPTNVSSTGQAIQAVAVQFDKAALTDANKRKVPVISGMHTLRISPTDPGRVASLKIRISDLLFVMNVKPFSRTWDTTSLPDGLHSVNVELLDETGALITTTRQEVYVRNRVLSTELSSCQW